MPEVKEDMKTALMHWHDPNPNDELTNFVLNNASWNDISECMNNVKAKVLLNQMQGKRTLVKSFFAGHGIMKKNELFAVTCDS